MANFPRLAYFSRIWERMVAPPVSVKEPLLRHRIRFLNSLLVIFVPLAIFAYFLQFFIGPPINIAEDTTTKSVTMGLGILLILYRVNHTRYYTIASYLAIGIGFVAIIVNAIASNPPHDEIVYLLMLPLVGILLLSMREIIIVCVLITVSIFVFARFMGDVPDDLFSDLVIFSIIMQVFIIFASHQRNLLEKDRQQQVLENEKVRILAKFFQDVSHEFRTPLSIINTGVYLIGKTPDADARQQRITGIQQQTAHITKLLDDMLTMTRLDSRILSRDNAFDIGEVVSNVVTAATTEADAKGLTLEVDLHPDVGMVQGDSEELEIALAHLLKNAVEYTSEGSVKIRALMQQTSVIIEIEDTGIGISEANMARIFERFYRVDQARSTSGTGLGLSIAQKIISDHQGRIEVETTLGQGSLFRVTLPASINFRKAALQSG